MKKINFIIAGYPKCATTALASMITDHPKCLRNKIGHTQFKEIYFLPEKKHFSTKELMTYDWYHTHWDWHKKDVLRFEKTPAYAFIPDGINMIKTYRKLFNQNLKIILAVRNPVHAYISRFKMYSRNNIYSPSKEDIRKLEENILNVEIFNEYPLLVDYIGKLKLNTYIAKHLYGYCYILSIKSLLNFMPQQNIKIVKQEDLKRNELKVINEIFTFLGIEKVNSLEVKNTNTAPKEKLLFPKSTIRSLESFYEPYNKSLYKELGIEL